MTRLSASDSRRSPRRRDAALDLRCARGAILVQTAAMLVSLTAFMAFIVDYGILWTARRQIQNAADAAAMAAASSLAFEAPGDQGRAQASALAAVALNPVWGLSTVMTDGDISFPACPPGAVGQGPCVRVEAFRNQARGNPLPTVFGHLAGVTAQGVRATATAQVLYADDTDCVRPMAIPDKWDELEPPPPRPWTSNDTFSRYGPAGNLLFPADYYELPGGGLFGPNGTGFSRGPSGANGGDFGTQADYGPAVFPYKLNVNFRSFLPVRIGSGGPGGFYTAMTSCTPTQVGPGSVVELEPSDVSAETYQAGLFLVNQDLGAYWDSSLHGGRGGVAGGCMVSGTCADPRGSGQGFISPRIIAIPAFNPDAWDAISPPGASTTVHITRVVGFFVEDAEPSGLRGRLMVYPVLPRSTMTASPESSFLASVTLVR